MLHSIKVILISLLVIALPTFAQAWGGRGHDAICETAAFLVKDKGLKEFLKSRAHTLGHLCNIPDTYWRSLKGDENKIGAPTHFIDPEVIGVKVNEIPLDYEKLITDYTGKDNKFKIGQKINSVSDELGSSWWRVDHFMRLIAGLNFKDAPVPEGKKEFQDEALPFNAKAYEMFVNMGLMGHFVGDASMPFHNSADYDGYATGHGGIHSYYESDVVSEFGPDLANEIYKKALSLKSPSFLKPKTSLEKMRELSTVSQKEMEKIIKLDPIIKKSALVKDKSMGSKSEAERKSAEVGYKIFRPMIIEQMARSSTLLAHLWDEAYVASGKPDLSKYRSFKYPFTPDFVRPDYIEKIETKK